MPSSPPDDRSTSNYRVLLHLPGAALFTVTAGAGRVGIAMTGLGLLLLVRQRGGSFADAGVAVAVFAVAEALLGPQVARLVDRWGQRRVLGVLVTAHAVTVASLLLDLAPSVVLAAGAGATIPQLGALSAARWAALLRRHGLVALLPAAFSLESLVNAVAYLVGPVLVTVLAGSVGATAGTATAAVLVVVAGLGLARQRRTAPPTLRAAATPGAVPGRRRGLWRPAFGRCVFLNLAIGVQFGAFPVAVTAGAAERGEPAVAGLLLGLSSAAGLVAGWAYGLRRWKTTAARQLIVLGVTLAAACVGLSVAGPLPVAGAAALAVGAVVPPVLVLSTVLAEASVPQRRLTQALTWLNSASAAGSAAATALVGHVVDERGAPAGFLVSAAAGVALAVVAAAGLARRRRTATHPHSDVAPKRST